MVDLSRREKSLSGLLVAVALFGVGTIYDTPNSPVRTAPDTSDVTPSDHRVYSLSCYTPLNEGDEELHQKILNEFEVYERKLALFEISKSGVNQIPPSMPDIAFEQYRCIRPYL